MAKYIVQLRRGTASQWADNNTIIPLEGELVIELDMENYQHKLKIGDGIHRYAQLAYLTAGGDAITQALTRAASITLYADQWQQANDKRWYQNVTVDGTTIQSNDKVDLQINAEQLEVFHEKDLAFVVENENGIVSAYCVGQVPQNDYTIQCTVMGIMDSAAKIIGNTTATPNPQPDWNQTNLNKADYIKNKPIIPSIEGLATEAYVNEKTSDLVESALAQAKASGEFDGADAPIPEIGDNGNWFINGVDTGVTALGTVISSVRINGEGHLMVTFSDGSELDAGVAKGTDGKDGADGKDGENYILTETDMGEIAEIAMQNEKGNIVNQIITELQGLPVFGVVDEDKTITVTSQLTDGTYTLKYEYADGTVEDIGTIVVGTGSGSGSDLVITGISAEYTGGSVTEGTAVGALTGITVTATYSDGSTQTVTDYTLSGTIKDGNNTITVTYEGFTTTFMVTGAKEVAPDTELTWEIGKKIDNSTGDISTDDRYAASNYVSIVDGYTYTITKTNLAAAGAKVCYYNASKKFLSTSGDLLNQGTANESKTITIDDDDAAFFRVRLFREAVKQEHCDLVTLTAAKTT